MPKTLFEKIWDDHFVARRMDGRDLIYIDRHVLHELHAPHAFGELAKQGRNVPRPDLTFSMQDHTVSTAPGRTDESNPSGAAFLRAMREGSAQERHPRLRPRRSGAGHLACGGAGGRHGAAGRDPCGARQPRLDRRRARRPGVRLRHHRIGAHPRHASDRDEAAEVDAHPARRHARPAGHRQGRGAAHHRRARHGRRARPCRRIRGRRWCGRWRWKAA